jgi:hypothetical protein
VDGPIVSIVGRVPGGGGCDGDTNVCIDIPYDVRAKGDPCVWHGWFRIRFMRGKTRGSRFLI